MQEVGCGDVVGGVFGRGRSIGIGKLGEEVSFGIDWGDLIDGSRIGFSYGGGEDLVFEFGDLVEFPGDEGELVDQDDLGGGLGIEFFGEFFAGDLIGGVGQEADGRICGGEVVFSGVLTRAGFAFW